MERSVTPRREEELSNFAVSFGISLAVTSIASALLVVAKERSPTTVLAAMKSATGHHWATHSLCALLLFLAIGFTLTRTNGGRGPRIATACLVQVVVGGIAVGSLVIGGYYLLAA